MPRRLNPRERALTIWLLADRDGSTCSYCGKALKDLLSASVLFFQRTSFNNPPTLLPRSQRTEIHHVNFDPKDWNPKNLKLTHGSCNQEIENKRRVQGPSVHTKTKSYNLVNYLDLSATALAHQLIDYKNGKIPMQATLFFEDNYRSWIMEEIRTKGPKEKKQAINGGAEFIGSSPQTTASYLSKLTSEQGPLREQRGLDGATYIVFKDGNKPEGT